MVSIHVTDVSCVLVDIEGTTSATSFVYDRLFPYSRERVGDYLGDPRAAGVTDQVAAELGRANPSHEEIVAALQGWIDSDAKVTPLKTLQGVIWEDGFARGELVSHLFPDVAPALVQWHRDGLALYVYSSGSIVAQRAWFGHTDAGDLNDLFSGNFDTASAGPKREPASYARITEAIGLPPERLLFLSDVAAELDAATACGWQVVEVSRPGEPHPSSGRYPSVSTFAEITID
jgi:enolase-phosphatase E1